MGRKLLKTVHCADNYYFSESSRGPMGTRRGPPLVRGPQFEDRWSKIQRTRADS